jgi:hypothetical protein
MAHQPQESLEAGLDLIREAPADTGTVELIVRRPAENERELLEEGVLDAELGLVGDMWSTRPSSSTPDGGPNPAAQVTVTSARAVALVAGGPDHSAWAPAGDQLYVDFDISRENLPAGARLAVGEAVLEVSEDPHNGCGKYLRRFGTDALKFVNSEVGRALRLRGLNARVTVPGTVRRGDCVRKL